MQRTISLPLAEEKARVSRQREKINRERAAAGALGFLLGVGLTLAFAFSLHLK